MTYTEVLTSIETMVANGDFTYLGYLSLIFKNWFSAAQYIFSCATIIILTKVVITAIALYTTTVVGAIKEEIEG